MTFSIESAAFKVGERIPERHAHPPVGEDVSPPLAWTDPPEGSKSFALICDDPDAPMAKPFVHWVLYRIPGSQRELSENEGTNHLQGRNDFDEVGWGGPLPPEGHGVHHYHFRLYAHDEDLDLEAGLDKDGLLKAIDGHVLGEAETVGTFER